MNTLNQPMGNDNLLSEASRRQRLAHSDLLNDLRQTMQRQNMLSEVSKIMRTQMQGLRRPR